MNLTRSRRLPLWRALLALAFALAQAAALAHEFDHVSHQHEAPCALHAFAEQLGKVATSMPLSVGAAGADLPAACTPHALRLRSIETVYRVRGPPSFSHR